MTQKRGPSCDRRMLRYLSEVRLQDHVQSGGVAERCKLRQISDVLRTRRLRWYGHVRRKEDGEVLATVKDWNVDVRRPRGRSRMTWMDNVWEDMRFLNITDELKLPGTVREGGVPSIAL